MDELPPITRITRSAPAPNPRDEARREREREFRLAEQGRARRFKRSPGEPRPAPSGPGMTLDALAFQSDVAIAWRSGGDPALEAARLGFLAIAALLTPEPPKEAYEALCLAARRLSGADAAWLLEPEEGRWAVLGCSLESGAEARTLAPHEARISPLHAEGMLVGALSYWSPREGASGTEALAQALEEAIAGVLSSRRALETTQRLSMRDALTGLLNRRALETTLDALLALARRTGRPLSVLMLDLDHFKAVNDAHGHEAGDDVLKAFADTVRQGLRHSDLAFRYGGEEFLVALPETSLAMAEGVAEKLRARVEGLAIRAGDATIRPTVSIGAASLRPDDDQDRLISRADRALYRAKAEGRNRVAHEED